MTVRDRMDWNLLYVPPASCNLPNHNPAVWPNITQPVKRPTTPTCKPMALCVTQTQALLGQTWTGSGWVGGTCVWPPNLNLETVVACICQYYSLRSSLPGFLTCICMCARLCGVPKHVPLPCSMCSPWHAIAALFLNLTPRQYVYFMYWFCL